MFAITAIKGIGRRYANIVLKKVSKPSQFELLHEQYSELPWAFSRLQLDNDLVGVNLRKNNFKDYWGILLAYYKDRTMSIPIFVQFITSYLLLETRVYAIFYF